MKNALFAPETSLEDRVAHFFDPAQVGHPGYLFVKRFYTGNAYIFEARRVAKMLGLAGDDHRRWGMKTLLHDLSRPVVARALAWRPSDALLYNPRFSDIYRDNLADLRRVEGLIFTRQNTYFFPLPLSVSQVNEIGAHECSRISQSYVRLLEEETGYDFGVKEYDEKLLTSSR